MFIEICKKRIGTTPAGVEFLLYDNDSIKM